MAMVGEKVFISYPRERREDAEMWRDELAERGLAPFVCHLDAKDIAEKPRDQQLELLRGRIREAAAVVVLWDRNYGRAAWCTWELRQALAGERKHVLFFSADATATPRALRDHTRLIAGPDDVVNALRSAPLPPLEVRGLALFPAASLLESRVAPDFDAPVRSAAEVLRLVAAFALCILLQVALYFAGKHSLGTPMRQHLWGLIAGVNIAMTLIEGVTLSLQAAIVAGFVGIVGGFLAMGLGLWHWGEPTTSAIRMATIASGTFHMAVVLLVRDSLLGEPWELPLPIGGQRGSLRAHAAAAAGILTIAILLYLGIEMLDFAMSYVARVKQNYLLILVAPVKLVFKIPTALGTLVGSLAGIPLGVSVYRRYRSNYRATAPGAVAVSMFAGAITLALAASVGYETGAWIRSHITEAIGALGGAYAGTLVGIMLAVGVTAPIALGTSGLRPRHERMWGVVGAAVVIGVVAYKIDVFPFGKGRHGLAWEIARGALSGVAPVLALRLIVTLRRAHIFARVPRRSLVPWMVAIALHLVVLGLFYEGVHSLPSSTREPIELSVISAQPEQAGPTTVKQVAPSDDIDLEVIDDKPAPSPTKPPKNPVAVHPDDRGPPITIDAAPVAQPDATVASIDAAAIGSAVSSTDGPAGNADTGSNTGGHGSASETEGGSGPGSGSEIASTTPTGSGAEAGSGAASTGTGSGTAAPRPPIDVVVATYGGNCGVGTGNVTATVRSMCNGKYACTFTADNGAFGDPRNGCAKDFIAQWKCGDEMFQTAPVNVQTNEGYAIKLECAQ